LNLKNKPLPEDKLQRAYRVRVLIFAFCAVLVLVLLGTWYRVVVTWQRLEEVERERDQWQRPAEVIQQLDLKEGNTVVDLGSGVGYFSLKLSAAVGKSGKVMAVDILKFPLFVLRTRAFIGGQHNIHTVLGEPENPHLAAGSVDAVLIVNTYHELTAPEPILDSVFRSLQPGGRLVVVDRSPDTMAESPATEAEHHHIGRAEAETEIRKMGFEILRQDDHFAQPPNDNVWWLIAARRPER